MSLLQSGRVSEKPRPLLETPEEEKKKKAAFFLPEGCDLPGQECRGGATSAKTHSSLGDTMKNVVAHGKRVTGMGGLEITRAPPPRRKRRHLAGVCLLSGGGWSRGEA